VKQECSTCRYFVKPQECHKGPPTVIPIRFVGQQPSNGANMRAVIPGVGRIEPGPQPERFHAFMGIFPPTQPTNWCGAYEAAPAPGS